MSDPSSDGSGTLKVVVLGPSLFCSSLRVRRQKFVGEFNSKPNLPVVEDDANLNCSRRKSVCPTPNGNTKPNLIAVSQLTGLIAGELLFFVVQVRSMERSKVLELNFLSNPLAATWEGGAFLGKPYPQDQP